jgi:hypothetical protein
MIAPMRNTPKLASRHTHRAICVHSPQWVLMPIVRHLTRCDNLVIWALGGFVPLQPVRLLQKLKHDGRVDPLQEGLLGAHLPK